MKAPLCGHPECWEAAIDGKQGRCGCVTCWKRQRDAEDSGETLDDYDCLDCCEHRAEIDSHHPCMECAVDRADAMNDAMKEGVL
jgi:hypothetical protein